MPSPKTSGKPLSWVIISAIGFIVFLLMAVVFSIYSDKLNFISSTLYFFLLVPLGLIAAAFLFGALKSYAKYSGKVSGGSLEMGGPVVVFALVILLGFKFRPQPESFQLVVNVFGDTTHTVIIQSGKIHFYFGGAKLTKEITEGQAIFNEIPQNARNKQLSVIPEVEGYSGSNQIIKIPTDNSAVTIVLQKNEVKTSVHGIVLNSKGNPVKDAIVSIENGLVKDSTDKFGDFLMTVPLREGTEVNIRVYLQDKIVYDNLARLSDKLPLTLKLQ